MSAIRSIKSEIRRRVRNPVEPIDNLLMISLKELAEEVGMKNIALHPDYEKMLSQITGDKQIKWNILAKKVEFYCSSCKTKLVPSDCGKFQCYNCDNIMTVKAKSLNKICLSCIEYQNMCKGNIETKAPNVIIKNKRTKKPITFLDAKHTGGKDD